MASIKTSLAVTLFVFSIQLLSQFHLSDALSNEKGLGARVYPYCQSVNDPTYPCAGKPNGNYPSLTEPCANYFFKCSNDKSYCYNCQNISGIILYYDPSEEECDYIENIPECVGFTTLPASTASTTTEPTTTTTQTTTTTTESTTTPTTTTPTTTTTDRPTLPDGFKCPDQNGNYPIDNSTCRKDYYQCINGVPFIATCPGDSFFDPAVLICKDPADLSCNFNCEEDGFFPVPGKEDDDCFEGFIYCVSKKAYPGRCPALAVFDPDLRFCVPYEFNDCPEPTGGPTTPGGTIPTFDPENLCCPGIGQWPYPGVCEAYFVCDSNSDITAEFVLCPDDLYFVPKPDGSGVCEPGTCSSADGYWLNNHLASMGRRPCVMRQR